MAITIRNITNEQIETAKALSGKRTASSGVVACVDLAASQAEMIAKLRSQVNDLEEKCKQSDGVIRSLGEAADQALTVIRQRRLF